TGRIAISIGCALHPLDTRNIGELEVTVGITILLSRLWLVVTGVFGSQHSLELERELPGRFQNVEHKTVFEINALEIREFCVVDHVVTNPIRSECGSQGSSGSRDFRT